MNEMKTRCVCADLACVHQSYYLQAERNLKAAAVAISSATSRVGLPSMDKTESLLLDWIGKYTKRGVYLQCHSCFYYIYGYFKLYVLFGITWYVIFGV